MYVAKPLAIESWYKESWKWEVLITHFSHGSPISYGSMSSQVDSLNISNP